VIITTNITTTAIIIIICIYWYTMTGDYCMKASTEFRIRKYVSSNVERVLRSN